MRAVVLDQLSGRQVPAGPEEVDAVGPLIFYLTQRLGWKPGQIMFRPQWRVPKSPSGSRSTGYPVDIAIFDAPDHVGDPRHVRILVECKASNVKEGINQLKTYLGLEPEARLGIWFNGERHRLVYKLPNGFVEADYAAIPRPSDPLVPTEAEPPLRHDDLRPPPNLSEIFLRLRDQIAAQDTHINRDEFILNDLANLLICKIADEQYGEIHPERPLAFQRAGDARSTAYAIREFFDKVKHRYPSIFTDEADRLHIDDASLNAVVRTLERYRLTGFDRHAVGKAFQVLRGRALKGEEGAYFTPGALVDCIVQLLAPDYTTRLIDPACGTGGFLAASLDYVFESIDKREDLSPERKALAKKSWAQDYLYAVDKDAVSTKLCKAYLTLLGDGRAHVFRANMIDRNGWNGSADDLARIVSPGRFDLVMTNPPFGQNLTVHPDVGRREQLVTCRKWRYVSGRGEPVDTVVEQQLGIAFFERGLDLLRPGGRMAIVLPETFLFSKTFRWFVDWVCRSVTVTHVIDVPMVAFEEFCRAKTCVVIIRKEVPPSDHHIIMSYPRSIGQDKRGKPVYQLNEQGQRAGELDNEMADTARELVGREYRGQARVLGSSRGDNRLGFRIQQGAVRARGIMVPRFWWRRDTEAALAEWTKLRPSTVVTLGSLADAGIVEAFEGHGSPPGNARATGDVPYVKVTDLKNWRINENPTNFIHRSVAERLRRGGVSLRFGDLITPARASSNIGQFSLVLPWQTHIVLTKEVLVIRVRENDENITSFLLLALMSLRVVQDQYKMLALMQTNREHLGDHWREVQIPLPTSLGERVQVGGAVEAYFNGIIRARESLSALSATIDPSLFGTWP
jgi:type I restriction enzyme M protein